MSVENKPKLTSSAKEAETDPTPQFGTTGSFAFHVTYLPHSACFIRPRFVKACHRNYLENYQDNKNLVPTGND